MIAVYPTAEEAGEIAPASGNPAETMHVTMVFLGDVSEIDLEAAARAVGSVSGSTAPLSGVIGGVGMFAGGPDGYPQLAIPNVQGLSKLRADIVQALAEEGIVSPSEHDWVPHMTLAYVEEPALPDLSVLGLPVSFGQLTLAVEDKRKDFPFDPEGSADDVHRPDPVRASYSRSEQRHLEMLINQARGLI